MPNYARLKTRAAKLIERAGQTAVLKRPRLTGTSYDPTVGQPGTYQVKVVVDNYTDFEVGQGRVRASDKKVYMAADSVEPEVSDLLVIGGQTHVIVGPAEGRGIIKIAPAGVAVLYELQARV